MISFLLIHLPEFTQLSFYLRGHYIRPIVALDMCLLNKMALSKDILVLEILGLNNNRFHKTCSTTMNQ